MNYTLHIRKLSVDPRRGLQLKVGLIYFDGRASLPASITRLTLNASKSIRDCRASEKFINKHSLHGRDRRDINILQVRSLVQFRGIFR